MLDREIERQKTSWIEGGREGEGERASETLEPMTDGAKLILKGV